MDAAELLNARNPDPDSTLPFRFLGAALSELTSRSDADTGSLLDPGA
jgi:hypothetical protein